MLFLVYLLGSFLVVAIIGYIENHLPEKPSLFMLASISFLELLVVCGQMFVFGGGEFPLSSLDGINFADNYSVQAIAGIMIVIQLLVMLPDNPAILTYSPVFNINKTEQVIKRKTISHTRVITCIYAIIAVFYINSLLA